MSLNIPHEQQSMSITLELRKAWQWLDKAGYTIRLGKFGKILTMFIPGIKVCWRKCWVEHCMVCLYIWTFRHQLNKSKGTKNCLKLSSNLTVANKNMMLQQLNLLPKVFMTPWDWPKTWSMRSMKNPLLPRHLLFATAKHHHALREWHDWGWLVGGFNPLEQY